MSDSKDIENAIEAALFSSERPLDARDLQILFGQKVDKKDIQSALETLRSHYADRGVELVEVAHPGQAKALGLTVHRHVHPRRLGLLVRGDRDLRDLLLHGGQGRHHHALGLHTGRVHVVAADVTDHLRQDATSRQVVDPSPVHLGRGRGAAEVTPAVLKVVDQERGPDEEEEAQGHQVSSRIDHHVLGRGAADQDSTPATRSSQEPVALPIAFLPRRPRPRRLTALRGLATVGR